MFYDNEEYKFKHIDDFIRKEFLPEFQEEVVIRNNGKEVKRKESCMTYFEIDFTRNDLLINNKHSINDSYYK